MESPSCSCYAQKMVSHSARACLISVCSAINVQNANSITNCATSYCVYLNLVNIYFKTALLSKAGLIYDDASPDHSILINLIETIIISNHLFASWLEFTPLNCWGNILANEDSGNFFVCDLHHHYIFVTFMLISFTPF